MTRIDFESALIMLGWDKRSSGMYNTLHGSSSIITVTGIAKVKILTSFNNVHHFLTFRTAFNYIIRELHE